MQKYLNEIGDELVTDWVSQILLEIEQEIKEDKRKEELRNYEFGMDMFNDTYRCADHIPRKTARKYRGIKIEVSDEQKEQLLPHHIPVFLADSNVWTMDGETFTSKPKAKGVAL